MPMNNVHEYEQRVDGGAVKSAGRVLDLLEFLAVTSEPAGVSEIARRLGMPKSSAFMLLATVESRGYIVCDGGRRYRLHPSLSGDGRSWIGGFRGPLLRVSRPTMHRLAEATGESVFLAVLRSDHRLEYINKALSSQDLRCDAELGVPRYLHSTSAGLVLLAGDEDLACAFLAAGTFERCTPRTVCDARRLRKELAQVARQGHAWVIDTNSPHTSGVAAPVRDADGRVVAALSLAGPTARFKAESGEAARAVTAAAECIARDLSRPADSDASRATLTKTVEGTHE
jgi:IclR family acetate operon transcriptional repressor